MEKELAVLMQAEKARTDKLFQQAKIIKMLATLLALIFAGFVLFAVIYMVKRNGGLVPHR